MFSINTFPIFRKLSIPLSESVLNYVGAIVPDECAPVTTNDRASRLSERPYRSLSFCGGRRQGGRKRAKREIPECPGFRCSVHRSAGPLNGRIVCSQSQGEDDVDGNDHHHHRRRCRRRDQPLDRRIGRAGHRFRWWKKPAATAMRRVCSEDYTKQNRPLEGHLHTHSHAQGLVASATDNDVKNNNNNNNDKRKTSTSVLLPLPPTKKITSVHDRSSRHLHRSHRLTPC